MKKLILVLLFVPLISFGQTSFLEKYENSLWTNGYLTLRFLDVNSMESKENNQEYFIVYDSIQNLKNIYEIKKNRLFFFSILLAFDPCIYHGQTMNIEN